MLVVQILKQKLMSKVQWKILKGANFYYSCRFKRTNNRKIYETFIFEQEGMCMESPSSDPVAVIFNSSSPVHSVNSQAALVPSTSS